MSSDLTNIPQARVGYDMIDSQRASVIIVLLNTPQKYSELNLKKNQNASKKSRVRLPYS